MAMRPARGWLGAGAALPSAGRRSANARARFAADDVLVPAVSCVHVPRARRSRCAASPDMRSAGPAQHAVTGGAGTGVANDAAGTAPGRASSAPGQPR